MRIQIEIDEIGIRVLEEIKKKTGLSTYKDIFSNAVTLLEWAAKQRAEGRAVASLDERSKNYRELQMPALEEAARRARIAIGASS